MTELRKETPKERRSKVVQSKLTPSELMLIQHKKAEDEVLNALSMSDVIRIALKKMFEIKIPDG